MRRAVQERKHRPCGVTRSSALKNAPITADIFFRAFKCFGYPNTAGRKCPHTSTIFDEPSRRVFRQPPGNRQGLFRQRGVHRVAHRPAQHLARMPAHHRAQVGVPVRHRDIRNVRTTDFVGIIHDPISQQIRIFPVPVIGNARAPGPAPKRFNPHFCVWLLFSMVFQVVVFHTQTPSLL